MIRMTTDPIDPDALRRELFDPAAGGYCAFEGRVRNENEGHEVLRLEYEGYAPVAITEGEKILADFETIRDTTAAAVPIVAQTELHNAETGLRAVIEYPVKTMNISLDKQLYQVDTGPVAYPDLSQRFEQPIEALSLAFVAFNAPDFADFVIEQPVKISEEAADDCRTYHYSKPFSLAAKNRLIAPAVAD